ncbi:MAG: cysteine desulfurase family protein [Lachnospiraceae bacterium]
MIYADNAATTQLAPEALAAMMPYLQTEYGNASQPYSFAYSAKKALKEARETIAACINADPEEIYFTSGGTESDNWALKGMMAFGDQRTIITSQIEHHAVLNACAAVERMGFPVSYLPVDKTGTVLPDTLRRYISDNTKMVSVMLVNNEIGTIEPMHDLATIAHEHGALMHTDAVQAIGHIPVDVKELQVDMLSASGHKFNAPKGIGFLYIKKGTPIKPFADGGAQEYGVRAGTENVASIVAMAVALKKNCEEMSIISARLRKMEDSFLKILNDAGIDFIRNGSNNRVPGNINISIKDASGEMVLHRLDLKKICISTGSACDSVNTQISHVIKAISVPDEYANGTIRISFGKENKEEDATLVADAIVEILK